MVSYKAFAVQPLLAVLTLVGCVFIATCTPPLHSWHDVVAVSSPIFTSWMNLMSRARSEFLLEVQQGHGDVTPKC